MTPRNTLSGDTAELIQVVVQQQQLIERLRVIVSLIVLKTGTKEECENYLVNLFSAWA